MKFIILIVFGVVTVMAERETLTEFAAGNNRFIGQLYKELLKTNPENFLVCPLSVQTIFSLMSHGAKGRTADQITTNLYLPENEFKRASTFLNLNRTLQTNNKYILTSANKIYVGNDLKINNNYQELATKLYNSKIQRIDFSKTHQAVAEINKWVEEKTYDKIKNLLSEDMVNAQTTAVLVNALYFQGKWMQDFEHVIKMPFYSEKTPVLMNMMKIVDVFNYYESPKLQAKFLELPYEGDEMSLTIILPNDIKNLSLLEKKISEVLVTPKYVKTRVNTYIPKFKIDTKIPFIPILKNMGIVDAFTRAADFSGISQEQIIITEVVQKAFIEVDEKGTTAAAATAVLVNRMGGVDYEHSFVANHPFIFYLKHRLNGIVFIGRYSTPGASESEPWLNPLLKER